MTQTGSLTVVPSTDGVSALEQHHETAVDNARLAIQEEEQERRRRYEHPENRLWRAIMVAPTLQVLTALLAGEQVPVSSLDQTWVARLGRRRAA